MSILIYERDGKIKERIFSFLKKRCVLSVVVANLNYCVDDFLIGKDNFALDGKGNYVEKRMIFEELNNLKGPIILYGKCSPCGNGNLVRSEHEVKLFKRNDSRLVENIFSETFINVYWNIYIDLIYKRLKHQ